MASHNQMKEIIRNPRAHMNFQITGRLPTETRAPESALRALIDKIPRGLWGQFTNVKVDASLGFTGSRNFNNLAQVHQWIGGSNKTIIGNRTMPYQSYMMRGFRKTLTIENLINNSTRTPNEKILRQHTNPRSWLNKE